MKGVDAYYENRKRARDEAEWQAERIKEDFEQALEDMGYTTDQINALDLGGQLQAYQRHLENDYEPMTAFEWIESEIDQLCTK